MSRPRRSVPIVVIALLLAGCSPGASSAPLPTLTSGAAATPTPGGPTLTPVAPTPSLVPSPAPLAPTSLDPTLVLSVDIRPDVSVGRMPDVSVYRDGTVLRRTDHGGDVMRLTSDGLAQVEAVADDSGLIRASTDIGPDPNYAAGFTTYSITFAANGVTVRRSVANAFPEAFRAEAQRFIALADRLATLDRWLPASAWLIGPAGAEPWIPDRYVLKVIDWGYVPDLVLPVDFADVVWPLDEGPLEVGDPADLSDLGAAAARCAVLPLDDARWIEAALSAAFRDQRIPAAYLQADLAWAERGSFLSIGLHVLLPDDADDCSLDQSWP